jgi:hypothetical protein
MPEPEVVETPPLGPSGDANATVAKVTEQDDQEIAITARDLPACRAAAPTDGDLRGVITKSVRDPAPVAGLRANFAVCCFLRC